MKKENFRNRMLRGIYNYLLFFLLVAFLVTCSTMLFVSVMAETLELELTDANLNMAAKLTFANVVFLSILFTVIDAVRRKLTTERITKHIAEAAKKVVEGDFSVRISSVNRLGADEKFNEILIKSYEYANNSIESIVIGVSNSIFIEPSFSPPPRI